jgi:hypothetical protein
MDTSRLGALSIELLGQEAKDKLAEEYGKVINNISTKTVSGLYSNKDLSGDPTSGSCEAKRFANVKGKKYGTARKGGAGQKIQAQNVVVQIDDDVEYIEEVEEKDIQMYGVKGLIEKRTANHQMVISIDDDVKFFKEMCDEGTVFTATGTAVNEIVSEAITTLQSVKNDFVNGVPLNLIKVAFSTAYYNKFRNYLDTTSNSNIDTSIGEAGMFHGVDVFSTVNLPANIDFVVFIDGAVAQPKHPVIYNPAQIGLSKAIGFGMFIDMGTKCCTPDLVFVKKSS